MPRLNTSSAPPPSDRFSPPFHTFRVRMEGGPDITFDERDDRHAKLAYLYYFDLLDVGDPRSVVAEDFLDAD